MMKLAIQDLMVRFFWQVAYCRIQPFRFVRDHASQMWVRQEGRLVAFMATQCLMSGWWGYHCIVKGRNYIVSVKEAPTPGRHHEN